MWCITAYRLCTCVLFGTYINLSNSGRQISLLMGIYSVCKFLGEYSDSVCNSATKINEPECWSRFVRWRPQSLMVGATNAPTQNRLGTQARFWSQKIMLGVQQNNGDYEKTSDSNPEFSN